MDNFNKLFSQIDFDIIPSHVGMILDGNGRYAKELGKLRTFGHYKGVENIKTLIPFVASLKVKELSLYCFSTENFNRPTEEVEYLMKLFVDNFRDYKFDMNKGYQIRIIGENSNLNDDVLNVKKLVNNEYKENTDLLCVNILFNYGSISEIKHCFELMIDKNISTDNIFENLYISTPVDLMIRTGGEKRLSNFLLLQLSYAELYFTDCWFPNFDKCEFIKAILEFQKRNRRFGSVKS